MIKDQTTRIISKRNTETDDVEIEIKLDNNITSPEDLMDVVGVTADAYVTLTIEALKLQTDLDLSNPEHITTVENLLNQTILYSFGKVRNVYLNEEKGITYTD